MGGLSKKASLIQELQRDGQQPSLVVTGGNLLFPTDHLDAADAQKAELATSAGVLAATQKMGATFAGIGSLDLAAGMEWLQQLHKPPAFNWLSANLVDPTSLKPLFTPILHRQAGRVKIAILAVTDHTAFQNTGRDFIVQDWRATLPASVATAEKDTDFVLLLSNYPYSENLEIARAFSSIDVILQTGHAIGNMNPIPVNNALLIQTDIRGKYLGVLDIDWQHRGAWTELPIPLDQKGAQQAASTYSNRFLPIRQSLVSDLNIEALLQEAQQTADAFTGKLLCGNERK
ncbi:MAG: hypothetical protein RBQ88_05350 [Desulfobulbus oligotrophicus]|nr:hypothetical protein [Desulfobulbus oligotrophicus]